jgi:DNA repair protein RadD
MTIHLRDYQQKLADDVRLSYRMGYRCPLVVASTGAGKTILFSYITHGAAQRGNPVLIAAHRKEIIRQISLSLARFGVEHQVIAAPSAVRAIKVAHFKAFGRSFVSASSTTMVGSVQTIVGRFDIIDATLARVAAKTGKPARLLVVMDEGHHVVADTQWGKVMDRYCGDAGGLGLIVTASPERLDGRGLGAGHGGYADHMIEGPPMSWLIENGFLSPYRIFTAAQQIDLAGVRTRMGDYVASDLQERVDKPTVTGDAIAHYRRHANGMRAVVFCVSISHSQHVAAEFLAAGIPSAHIDGATDDAARDQSITDFADGKVQVLTQVNLVSEGFDLGSIAQKDVTIDCIIDLAPTASLVNAMQRWGRALRPGPGKTAILLDHAGNVLRHGLPDEERQWSLEGRKKTRRKADNDNEPDVKISTCTQCFAVHAPAPECPACGHVYPIKERKVEQQDGDLQELTDEAMEALRRQKRIAQGQAQSVEALVAQGVSRFRAVKIIEAREAKQALIGEIVDALQASQQRTGMGPYQTCGHTLADIRRMKPKELKELQAKLPSLMTVAA